MVDELYKKPLPDTGRGFLNDRFIFQLDAEKCHELCKPTVHSQYYCQHILMKSVACAIIWRSFYLGFRTIHAHVVQLSQSSCTAVIAALSPCTFSRLGPNVDVTRSGGVHGVRGVLTDKSLTRQIFFRYTAFVARPITQQSELRYRVQHFHSKKPA